MWRCIFDSISFTFLYRGQTIAHRPMHHICRTFRHQNRDRDRCNNEWYALKVLLAHLSPVGAECLVRILKAEY